MANGSPLTFLPPVFLLLIVCGVAHGLFIANQSSPDLISDGVHDGLFAPSLPRLNSFRASESCERTYGFMPCTTTALGNLFLIFVYGYLMFLGARYLSSGSELLLEILGPGLVLPMRGALPDAMLILVCGLSGSTETAQSQVSIGMGLLAGSTIMLLTVIWGTCVVVGKCDLQDSIARDGKDTMGFSLTGSGVSTDIRTSYATRIMAVFQPWIQRRRLDYTKHKHEISGILRHLKMHALGRLFRDDGTPNKVVIKKLFKTIDMNHDGYISADELRALIVGLKFDEINLDEDEASVKMMKDFDTSLKNQIDLDEFIAGISKWIEEEELLKLAKNSGTSSYEDAPATIKHLDDFHWQTNNEHDLLGDQSDEIVEGIENPKWTFFKALLLLLLGTVIVAVFADPLVDVIDNFSDATSIPTFFISFITLHFTTGSSELYRTVTMNNLLCLSVFLALVYARGLTWDFLSEVLIIFIVCIVMGGLGSFRTSFPLWTSLVAFLLYPFSLVLVYVLNYVFG